MAQDQEREDEEARWRATCLPAWASLHFPPVTIEGEAMGSVVAVGTDPALALAIKIPPVPPCLPNELLPSPLSNLTSASAS